MNPAVTPTALAALDIAGTTLDEGGAVYRVLAAVVAEHGTPADDAAIRRWMGADKREALGALTGERDPRVVEALHDRFVAALGEAYAATPPRPFPGVVEALAALRAHGVAVVLTTGFDRQVTDPLLAAVGWAADGTVDGRVVDGRVIDGRVIDGRVIDGVVCAEEVDAGRPAPAMIRRAMALTGVDDARRVIAAGDTVLDVAAGRAAGAGVVAAVLTGAQGRDELVAAGPTHVVAGVRDLPALLAALSPGAR